MLKKGNNKFSKILFVLVFFMVFSGSAVYAVNPLVSDVYTADPAGFIGADGRLYVICSHDQAGATNYNQLVDYILLSSSNLVDWTNHGVVFSVRDVTTWAGLAYAPDMLYRNGQYYLYFPNGASSIGVAISNSPTGPWRDPVGGPIVTGSTPGVSGVQWVFDPGVFVDDDGQGYLYFGGGGPGNARVIKLTSDYLGVTGSAVTIDAPRFFEASYMHKRNGVYYFSYSSDFSAGAATIEYMTSSNPMTGFTHRGTILNNPWSNLGNNNHHSIIEYSGQWYIFYHNRALSNSIYQRSACLDRLYYNSDGTIQLVNDTQAGVPAIDPVTPTPDAPTPTPNANANIIVRAKGNVGGENLEVHVDGETVATFTMTTGYQDYYAEGNGQVEIHFTNDDQAANGRDIQVDNIVYNGSTYQAEDQEINTAVYIDGSCGGSYSEMMECNGYIRFNTGNNQGDLGDVNNDGNIDIVDALLIAQYYVGLDPDGFDTANADVDCSGTIDIVDALLVAQYYVGLISSFC